MTTCNNDDEDDDEEDDEDKVDDDCKTNPKLLQNYHNKCEKKVQWQR